MDSTVKSQVVRKTEPSLTQPLRVCAEASYATLPPQRIARDRALDSARMIAAIWILILHGATYYYGAGGAPIFGRHPWALLGNLAMWGRVPFFFFLGGYFAARSLGKNPGDTAQFLKRRFIALLPPYLFWNLVSVSLMAAALVAGFQLVETDHLDLTTILMRITGFGLHPADASLWFIRDFLICICFAPLLMRLGVWSLIPCMVLAIIPEIPDDLFKHGFPRLSSLGYFGIGMLLALAPRGITAKLFPRPGRACIMILCVGLVYAICDFPKPGLAGVILGALGILLTGQFIDQSIPKLAAWMGKHASASFIIFAANAPLLAVAKQAYIRYQFGIPLALYFTVLTIAFFFLSIAFHSLVKRYLPGLLMLVSGGR